jgi:hypothetical protein
LAGASARPPAGRQLWVKGTQTLDQDSSDQLVLMDEATQHIAPSNARAVDEPRSRIRPRIGRLQVETSVRSSDVVVGSVGPKHPLEVAPAEYQHPVQALGPDRADPPLSESVRSRRPDRGFDDRHALCPKDLVEGTRELGVTVTDHEPDSLKALPHRQVAGLLGDPRRLGVARYARDVDSARSDLDRK